MRLIDPIGLKQALVVSAILEDKKTIEQIIDEQPTIEERKKGEWKPTDGASYQCSVCGRLSFYRTYYCAHCGADMT